MSSVAYVDIKYSQRDYKVYCVNYRNTVKPAQEITSVKQSHVLKGHPFLVLS